MAYPDSLEQAFARAKGKEERLSTLSYLADWYLYRDLEKSMGYLQQADQIGWKSWRDAYLIAKSFGTAYQIVGYYDSAVYWQQLAHQSAIKSKNWRYEGITANNLANAFYGLGQFDSAYVYALKAVGPAQKAGNKLGVAISKEFIAILEGEFGQMDSSLSYFLQSARLFKSLGERNFEAMSYVNAVRPLSSLGGYDQCWELIRKAEVIQQAEPDPFLEASLWFAKGHVLNGQQKYRQAWQSFDSSYALFESLGALERLASIHFERGRIKNALKDYSASEQLFLPLIPELQETKQWSRLTQLYAFLAEGYAAQNKMADAYLAMQQLDAYRDSLQFISSKSELAGMAVKYALDKTNIELKNMAQRAAIERRQFYAGMAVLLLGLVALAIIIGLVLKTKRQTELLNAQLEGQNAFKNKLFASIGHDLRAPLSQAYSAVRMLRRSLSAEHPLATQLEQLQSRQQHALQVSDDLLDWVGTQWAGSKKLQEVRLAELFKKCIALFQNNLDDKQLQIELPAKSIDSVVSDEQAVALLFRNIVSNAIKFSPANAVIKVDWGTHESGVWLEVSDAGEGFPADWQGDLQKLAERFERLPSHDGSVGEKGSGFGLMLCATFAKELGIGVILGSSLDGGAKVKVQFPKV